MKRDEAARILAEKQRRLAGRQKIRPAAGSQSLEGGALSPEPVPEELKEKHLQLGSAAADGLAAQVRAYTDEYLRALEEMKVARQRLIDYRGGEGALTEDDLLTLENIADIVRSRYERLLER